MTESNGLLKEVRDDVKSVLTNQATHTQWIKDHTEKHKENDKVTTTRLNSHSKSINWLKVKVYVGLSIVPILYTLYKFKIIHLIGEH